MPGQTPQFLPGPGVPDFHEVVPPSAGQVLAIGTGPHAHGSDLAVCPDGVGGEPVQDLAGCQLPDEDGPTPDSSSHVPTIRAERHVMNFAPESSPLLQDLNLLTRDGIPDPHDP